MKELHVIIRDLREDLDIKQKTVAEYLGVSQQTYSNYENGRRDIPLWAVLKLSEYFKVSTDYLLGADSGYLGSPNLNRKYLGDVTMHDVLFRIQKLDAGKRRELLRFIRFLGGGGVNLNAFPLFPPVETLSAVSCGSLQRHVRR